MIRRLTQRPSNVEIAFKLHLTVPRGDKMRTTREASDAAKNDVTASAQKAI